MRIITALLIILLVLAPIALAQDGRQLVQEKGSVNRDKRIALVIGNGAYTKAKTLPNPANDATDMAKALKEVGFEVLSGVDLNKRQMQGLIRDFGTKLASGGIGLFYYAGHGVQVRGENYLIPVDAEIPTEEEVQYQGVPLGLALTMMTSAKNDLNIVILDACRNNPFARSWRGYRDVGNNDGLAKISPPTGTLVLYSTVPGSVASDGTGRNGLFTEALLKQIKRPNIEYDQMVKALSADVWQKSNQQQLPWKEGNSLQDFYFSISTASQPSPTSTAAAPKPTPLPTPTPVTVAQSFDAEGIYWNEIGRRDTRSGYELYLAEYPTGKYAADAKNRIDKFKQGELLHLKEIERTKWREAQSLDRKDAYNAYIAAYPNGEFVADARSGIKTLENKEERAKWNAAQSLDSKDAYQSYLSAYPNGEFAANARSSINALETKEDQAKWDEVQILNRKTAFQSYLSTYPNGKYAATAKQRIKEFEDAEALKQKEQEKAVEKAKWDEAERVKTVSGYKDYLTAYPKGEFASLARLSLRDLGIVLDAKSVSPPTTSNNAGPISVGAVRKNSIGMELVYIPPGEFMMGAAHGEADEKPVHRVTISQGFWMGKYEVTQSQYENVVGKNPSYFKDCADCPVEQVSWNDAKEFISWLNTKNDGFEYSLPSEAQWEYAARAGTTEGDNEGYYGDPNSIGWHGGNSGGKTHPVGQKQANAFGLYDIQGNVSEWCEDWYESYSASAATDPKTDASNGSRVLRGGSWSKIGRLASRHAYSPSGGNFNFGFRVAARLR